MADHIATTSLEQAYQEFTGVIRTLSDEQFLASMDGWSPRDVVAHLIGWNGLMIEASSAILAGMAPTYYADAQYDYEHINAGFTSKYSSRSKRKLLKELKSSLDRFVSFIASLPPEELDQAHGVLHYSGRPATVARVITSLAGDYQHHSRQIADWIQQWKR
jgi:hypothetical protein